MGPIRETFSRKLRATGKNCLKLRDFVAPPNPGCHCFAGIVPYKNAARPDPDVADLTFLPILRGSFGSAAKGYVGSVTLTHAQ